MIDEGQINVIGNASVPTKNKTRLSPASYLIETGRSSLSSESEATSDQEMTTKSEARSYWVWLAHDEYVIVPDR
jgi:hypothetical protein